MQSTIIVQGLPLDEFYEGIKEVNQQLILQKYNEGEILAKWVPELTRGQAAYILKGSISHVVKLIESGHLQMQEGGKFSTAQVWSCKEAGLLGRKWKERGY